MALLRIPVLMVAPSPPKITLLLPPLVLFSPANTPLKVPAGESLLLPPIRVL